MKPKTIHQLLLFYGFVPTDYGYVKTGKNYPCITTRVEIPKEKRHKSIRMVERYLKEGILNITGKSIQGTCKPAFVGFWQGIQSYRTKEYNKVPSKMHDREVSKIRYDVMQTLPR